MKLWPGRLDEETIRRLEIEKNPFFRRLELQERVRGGAARCLMCERRCIIKDGGAGACGLVYNFGGELYTVAYGLLTAAESRPAEIKPFHHYALGSSLTTISTWGCNFPCPWCQNWHLSKRVEIEGFYIDPRALAELSKAVGDVGVNVSFNEPTMLLDYAANVGRAGAKLSYNTNGYMTMKALDVLIKAGLEAANVDIKGDERTYRRFFGARFDVVWRNVRLLMKAGVHLELTVLVIPGVNDDLEWIGKLAGRIFEELGPDVPLHVTRFYPAYAMGWTRPTSVYLLEEFRRRAVETGLRYVYIGNVRGNRYEHTYCPRCGSPIIVRRGGQLVWHDLTSDGTCRRCGERIPLKLWPPKGYSPYIYMSLWKVYPKIFQKVKK